MFSGMVLVVLNSCIFVSNSLLIGKVLDVLCLDYGSCINYVCILWLCFVSNRY
jgi:hypothetical protein